MYTNHSAPYILVGGGRGVFSGYATIPGEVGAGFADHVTKRRRLVPNFNRSYAFPGILR